MALVSLSTPAQVQREQMDMGGQNDVSRSFSLACLDWAPRQWQPGVARSVPLSLVATSTVPGPGSSLWHCSTAQVLPQPAVLAHVSPRPKVHLSFLVELLQHWTVSTHPACSLE